MENENVEMVSETYFLKHDVCAKNLKKNKGRGKEQMTYHQQTVKPYKEVNGTTMEKY